MRKSGITLLAFGCLALFGCNEGTMAPDSQASFDETSAEANTDRSARNGRFGHANSRLIEAIEEKGDEQALALLTRSQEERESARAAFEAGDEETARTHLEASREAMHEAVTLTFPEYAERMEQARERWSGERPEGFTRGSGEFQGRGDRMRFDESRMQGMIESLLERNPENVELIEQVKQEMEAMHAAMEAGDEDAAREHAQAMREIMQELRPDMPERGMRGRMGERRQ